MAQICEGLCLAGPVSYLPGYGEGLFTVFLCRPVIASEQFKMAEVARDYAFALAVAFSQGTGSDHPFIGYALRRGKQHWVKPEGSR